MNQFPHRQKLRYLVFASLLILVALDLTAQTIKSFSQSDTIHLDPAVRYGRLPNGFTYFIRKNSVPADNVEMRLVVKAGSYHEDEDQLGLPHLLEHMAFNGTKHYPGNSLWAYSKSVGIKTRGATGGIRTLYRIQVPGSTNELLDKSLQMLRDWAHDMLLEPEEIDNERGVVLGEARFTSSSWKIQADGEAKVFGNPEYLAKVMKSHDESINTFKHEALIRFYKDWYRPDMEAVIIAGNIDVDEMEDKIKTLFTDLQMPTNPRNRKIFETRYAVKLDGKNKLITYTDKESKSILVQIFQKRKATLRTINSVGDFRTSLVDKLYNHLILQRLNAWDASYGKPFESAANGVERNVFDGLSGLDVLRTTIKLKKSQPLKTAILGETGEINRIARDGFLFSELENAKKKIGKELTENSQFSKFTSSTLASRYESYFIDGNAAPSPETEIELTRKLLADITLDEVNSAARSWILIDQNTDVVIIAPDSKDVKLPTQRDVFKWLADSKKVKLPAYHEPEITSGELVKPGELPIVNAAEVIKGRSEYNELGVKEIMFANGMCVLLKSFKPEGRSSERIIVSGYRPGGASSYRKEEYHTATNAGSISNWGAGRFDKVQVEKLLNNRGMLLGVWLDKTTAKIDVNASVDDLEVMFQLLYLQLSAPRKDRVEFNHWKVQKKETLSQKEIISMQSYRDSVAMVLYEGDNTSLLTIEELNKIDLDRMYEIYKKEFSSLEGFTFVVSGDFNEEKVIELFAKYLGSLKSNEYKPSVSKPLPPYFPRNINGIFYGGNEQVADVELHFPGKYTQSFKNDLMLQILKQALEIELYKSLREKESGTYSVTVQAYYNMGMGTDYSFSISFLCAPDNANHMIATALKGFTKLKTEGFDEKTFHQAKQEVKRKYQDNLNNVHFWPQYLEEQFLKNDDPNQILKTAGVLDLIILETINKAARQYFTTENMMKSVLLPESYRPKTEN